MSDPSLPDNSPVEIKKYDWEEVHYIPYKGSIRDRFVNKFGNKRGFIRKMLTLLELFLLFLFFRFNPYRFLYTYTERLIEKEGKPEALIISANPYPQFAVGFKLNKKYNLPWFADYRDDWTTNEQVKNRNNCRNIELKAKKSGLAAPVIL